MNENDRYIPPSQGGSGPGSPSDGRPPQLAKIGLVILLVALLAGVLHSKLFPDVRARSTVLDLVVVGGVLVSFVMAIAALITRRGRPGVIGAALSTLIIGGLLLSIGVYAFVSARERALKERDQPPSDEQVAERFRSAMRAVNEQAKEAKAPPAVDRRVAIQKEIQQALAPYTREQMSAWSACAQATREFRAAGEFSPAAFITKESIEARRAMLVRIVNATEAWENLQVAAESKVTEALNLPSIPPQEAQRYLENWRKDRAREIPVLMRMRTAERNSSRALIGLLSILEHELGQWELSPDKKSAIFKRGEASLEYRELAAEAATAAQEQKQLSAQFAALLKEKETQPGPRMTTPPSKAPAPAVTSTAPTAPAPGPREKWVGDLAKATKAEGEILRIAQPYFEALFDRNEVCNTASNASHAAGPLDPRQLSTRAAITERRALVQRVLAAAEQWEELALNTDQALATALNRPGIPADQARTFLERWKDGRFQPVPLMKRGRANDRMTSRTVLGILALLERELGQWEVSADGKQVRFKRPGCSDELRKLMKDFSTQNAERVEVTRQIQAFAYPK